MINDSSLIPVTCPAAVALAICRAAGATLGAEDGDPDATEVPLADIGLDFRDQDLPGRVTSLPKTTGTGIQSTRLKRKETRDGGQS